MPRSSHTSTASTPSSSRSSRSANPVANQLTVSEAAATYASAMRNILHDGNPVSCSICRTFIDPANYQTCFKCSQQPNLLDVAVPITYSEHLGQLHQALRGYKDAYRKYRATRCRASPGSSGSSSPHTSRASPPPQASAHSTSSRRSPRVPLTAPRDGGGRHRRNHDQGVDLVAQRLLWRRSRCGSSRHWTAATRSRAGSPRATVWTLTAGSRGWGRIRRSRRGTRRFEDVFHIPPVPA